MEEKFLKILITGVNGFIGKNLIAELRNKGYNDIVEYNSKIEPTTLNKYIPDCDFVIHLAGVNRPLSDEDMIKGNVDTMRNLLSALIKNSSHAPILFTSSIQAVLDNPYGNSKRAAENMLFDYSKKTGANVMIYRLPNVFGKWCRPDYNSVVATFCNNVARELPVQIKNSETMLSLVYVDDVISELISAIEGQPHRSSDTEFYEVNPIYKVTLGYIIKQLNSFANSRTSLLLPDMSNDFINKLYSTYTSYLPCNKFSYPLVEHMDCRGSFTEFACDLAFGQISINVSKPGITKGNHWHHSKCEKFLVVSGEASIQLRKVGDEQIITYTVSGSKLEVVDIPPGYTHSILNIGDRDLVTVIWSNRCFIKDKPDTYFLEVSTDE